MNRGSNETNYGYTICLRKSEMESFQKIFLSERSLGLLDNPLTIVHCNATSDLEDSEIEAIPNIDVINICSEDILIEKKLDPGLRGDKTKMTELCPLISLVISPYTETVVFSQLSQINLTTQHLFDIPEYSATGALLIREKSWDISN
jgi:hypothetical protein